MRLSIAQYYIYRSKNPRTVISVAVWIHLVPGGCQPPFSMVVSWFIGASVSEPHTSELNRDFSLNIIIINYYFLSYVVLYISDAVI